MDRRNEVLIGDALATLKTLDNESVQCCVTSPPYYGLRDYGVEGQLGLESTLEKYVENLVGIFREVRRVLRGDGTLWLNLGDSYNGSSMSGGGKESSSLVGTHHTEREGARFTGFKRDSAQLKPKNLLGIPWRVAFALQNDGWCLRSDIIWHKPNPMPESVTDRPTKSHEHLFLLSKNQKYYYDHEAIKENAVCGTDIGLFRGKNKSGDTLKNGAWNSKSIKERQSNGIDSRTANIKGKRNKRDVWTVATKPYNGAHFAVFPPALIEPCIKAGCPEGGIVLDPFIGSGVTAFVAQGLGRDYLGIDINPANEDLVRERMGVFQCQS